MHGNPETAALRISRNFWMKSDGSFPLPVEPKQIVQTFGLKYYEADLGPILSGMLVRPPHQTAQVHVNRDDGSARQRFACAHELGHYVLRGPNEGLPTDEGDGSLCFRGPLSELGIDPEEKWANKFAAALLMPRKLVESMHRKMPDVTILAGKFGTSPEAMRFRLENLGLSRGDRT